ncbi:MAG: alkaline phosphatase family protein [Desulfobulbaceae bacterium]|nr:MAG: alkaline phosphatase family protein [Desulfobulbaceae bacterium]
MNRQNKVLLIVIDGCRPDGLEVAETPVLDELMETGSFSMTAQTTYPALTLPCHFSLVSGQKPIGHNVQTNTGQPSISPETLSIFQLAKYRGLTTAIFYSWEHLRNLAPPGVLDLSLMINVINNPVDQQDRLIVDSALPHIQNLLPDLCFVYLEGTDIAGHEYGWMSEEYIQAIERADHAIGELVKGLEKVACRAQYNIIVTSDHGGVDRHHMERVPEVLTVPWIMQGPDIAIAKKLTRQLTICDIAPTIARLLNIPPYWEWQGSVATELLN